MVNKVWCEPCGPTILCGRWEPEEMESSFKPGQVTHVWVIPLISNSPCLHPNNSPGTSKFQTRNSCFLLAQSCSGYPRTDVNAVSREKCLRRRSSMSQFWPGTWLRRRKKGREERAAVIGWFLSFLLHFTVMTGFVLNLLTHTQGKNAAELTWEDWQSSLWSILINRHVVSWELTAALQSHGIWCMQHQQLSSGWQQHKLRFHNSNASDIKWLRPLFIRQTHPGRVVLIISPGWAAASDAGLPVAALQVQPVKKSRHTLHV